MSRPHLKLINMSRGGTVDEAALLSFLQAHPEAGACVDVRETEPVINDTIAQLMTLGHQFILTPHIGAMTVEGNERMHRFAF